MSKQKITFSPLPFPQTPETAQNYFVKHGISKAAWARHFGLNRCSVEHLLSGRAKGRRGNMHEAAVKLGLKEQPDGNQ